MAWHGCPETIPCEFVEIAIAEIGINEVQSQKQQVIVPKGQRIVEKIY